MATRSRTSFQKRQKEIARAEKQRDKAAKRVARKLNPSAPEEEETMTTAEAMQAELDAEAESSRAHAEEQ
jgi:hypothetical protein